MDEQLLQERINKLNEMLCNNNVPVAERRFERWTRTADVQIPPPQLNIYLGESYVTFVEHFMVGWWNIFDLWLYSIENLHIMAVQLGIKRCWFHNGKFAHYDIPKLRIKEIETKCIIVDSKSILKIIKG